jgi:acyl transferase domain-containing protein
MSASDFNHQDNDLSIAIIGMSGRFPGAQSLDEFWSNIRNGIESIRQLRDEELLHAGVDAGILKNKSYVKACSTLSGIDLFDASFFGMTPLEVEITDPQHRLFLECAWEALEHAGYAPGTCQSPIGVYAGANSSSYFLNNIYPRSELVQSIGAMQLGIANEKDYLSSRIAYHLDLRGPAVAVQSACSTSLVAVHLACQSILNGECEMALAGGVSITNLRVQGYFYTEGSIASPDGHCRAFDAQANGTVFGDGLGIVVLKSLNKALEDGDTIHAVIRGSAVNNDGADKASLTAPSVNGQASAVIDAQAMAGIDPDSISYIETHGTGTTLGDPIEIRALQQAFGESRKHGQFCAIGSLKTNIGHLNVAAGVAGLIKTVLALKHREIPPSLHFDTPSPHIDFANSPFYVNSALKQWHAEGPRRAGVSSFGIGGTNAHVIIEEAPAAAKETVTPDKQPEMQASHLLLLSAKTAGALDAASARLKQFLADHPDTDLADVAYTTQVGRRHFAIRRAVACTDHQDAIRQLGNDTPHNAPVIAPVIASAIASAIAPDHAAHEVVFLFPGQGTQYVNMARELYQSEETFRAVVDRCSELLKPLIGHDLRQLLYPEPALTEEAASLLRQTQFTQPALFVVEYALARQLDEWGIIPGAMAGHSIGEYVAACIAGVFSLEDALTLVAQRGKLIASLPGGAMLAVHASESAVQPLLNDRLWIAAVNAPALCSVSGGTEAIEELTHALRERQIDFQPLHTSHAFHSGMMDPILDDFTRFVTGVQLHPPRIRYVSNVSGDWITPEQATSPAYWAAHLRSCVRFSSCLDRLAQKAPLLYLETGPGQTLSSLARMQASGKKTVLAFPSLPGASSHGNAMSTLLHVVGKLWLNGMDIDWRKLHRHQQRRRIPLPAYPFERKRYWLEVPKSERMQERSVKKPFKRENIADWLYTTSWKRSTGMHGLASCERSSAPHLVFLDHYGLSRHFISILKQSGEHLILVKHGPEFSCECDDVYVIDNAQSQHHEQLLRLLHAQNKLPRKITHLCGLSLPTREGFSSSRSCDHQSRLHRYEDLVNTGDGCEESAYRGPQPSCTPESGIGRDLTGERCLFDRQRENDVFFSLVFLAQAIGKLGISSPMTINVVSSAVHSVIGNEPLAPEKALTLGPVHVIPLEYPSIRCRHIDLAVEDSCPLGQRTSHWLMNEINSSVADTVVAYRHGYRWTRIIEPIESASSIMPVTLRRNGHYLVTGGLGGIGFAFARYLASKELHPVITLVGRSPLPAADLRNEYASLHDDSDPACQKIRQIRLLESLGAKVNYVTADISDEAGIQELAHATVDTFGPVHGIFHAAGVPGKTLVQDMTFESAHAVLSSKVAGTLLLERAFASDHLDFLLLCSSISALKPLAGQVDYCAANAFIDAFAHGRRWAQSTNVMAINWTAWKEVGMAADMEVPAHLRSRHADFLSRGISVDDAPAVFELLLSNRSPQVIVDPVSTDGQAMLAGDTSAERVLDKPQAMPNHPPTGTAHSTSGNETEQKLAGLWASLFGISGIGIHDDFFDLGGHSLLGTQLMSKVRASFEVDLPVRALFEAPTVAALAQRIALAQQQQAAPASPSIVPVSRDQPLPLSYAQQRLWFIHEHMAGQKTTYNMPIALQLHGALSVDALRSAFHALVMRHEILRATFAASAGEEACLRIAPSPVWDMPIIPVAEDEVARHVRDHAHHVFDLAAGPLIKVDLLRLAANRHILLINTHHIVSDGWSQTIMTRDMQQLYAAALTGRPANLPALSIQYADYAAWQRQQDLGLHLDYWQRQLAGYEDGQELPYDYPRPPHRAWRAGVVHYRYPAALAGQITALGNAQQVTLFMTLLSAFAVVLHQYTGRTDLCIGTTTAGRDRLELEPLIGFFINIVPLRLDLSGDPDAAALLQRVKSTVLQAVEHHALPFEHLLNSLQLQRDGSRIPLVPVMLRHQNFPPAALDTWAEGLLVQPLESSERTTASEIDLQFFSDDSGLRVMVEYAADLFAQDTIERMIGHHQQILEALVASIPTESTDDQINTYH